MIKIIFTIIMCLLPVLSVAAPVPTSATISGGFLNISGAAFGTKITASPLVHNDFEADTVGALPLGWTKKSGDPVVSDARPYGGSKSFLSNHPSASTGNQMTRDLGENSISTKLYLSGNLYIEKNDTNAQFQFKVWRWSGYPNVYYRDNYPDIVTDNSGAAINIGWLGSIDYYNPAINYFGWNGSNGFYYTASTTQHQFPTSRDMFGDLNRWNRVEQVFTLSSTPGAADGHAETYINGQLTESWTGLVTQAVGDKYWRYFMLTNEIESVRDANMVVTTTADMKFYWDDLYIDNTFARVEICNTPTWAARTHCEIQPPTDWADTGIIAAYTPLTFVTGSTAYVYVIDSDGNANSNGYEITIAGGTADTTKPVTAHNGASRGATSQSVTLTCSDNVGCNATTYCIGTAACTPLLPYSAPISVKPGKFLCFKSTDSASNEETTKCFNPLFPIRCN